MKNRKLILILSLVLALTMSLGGTLAYLTDTASDVNTMVLGNVDIEQHEYQRAKNEDGTFKTDTIDNRTSYVLEGFKNDKPLLPAIIPNGGTVGGVTWDYDPTPVRMSQVESHGGASVFNTANAVDKFVTVENTGKTDAYVRTLIAFEVGNATLEKEDYPYQPLISSEIRAAEAEKNTNGQFPWTYGFSDYVVIKGNKYLVHELIYTGAMTSSGWKHENGVLPAGETTYPNLCQVYMASWANNKEVVDLDGNANGTYDILVLSQAIQADGFATPKFALDTGFGEATAANIKKWFEGEDVVNELPYPVSNAAELEAAVKAGNTNITLATGTYTMPAAQGKTLTLTGAGADTVIDIKVAGGEGANGALDGATVTLNNLKIQSDGRDFTGWARSAITYNDCVIDNTYFLYGPSVFNNCTFNDEGNSYNIWTYGAPTAEFNNCVFNCEGKSIYVDGNSTTGTKVTINGCTFNDVGDNTVVDNKAAVETGTTYGKTYELIINDTKVNGFAVNPDGIDTGSTLWANKHSMGTDKLNVVIDGVDVY